MNLLERPQQAPGAIVEEMDGGAILYKLGAEQVLSLNETALLIWKLCDGSRTAKEIIDLLAAEYPGMEAEIGDQVDETVKSLIKQKALVFDN